MFDKVVELHADTIFEDSIEIMVTRILGVGKDQGRRTRCFLKDVLEVPPEIFLDACCDFEWRERILP
eukprot:scaffold39601_cov348-Isochrysis_galbana.AAC.1